MAAKPPNRFQVQNKFLPLTRIREEWVTVIGAGRQVALQLVALGIPKLSVIDPALVEPRHVTSQGYRADDVGKPKVDCIGDVCHQAEPRLDYTGVQDAFRPAMAVGSCVFCCVDSFTARKLIWLSVERRCQLWIDVRLESEAFRVFSAEDESSKRRYAATLAARAAKRRKASSSSICIAGLAASLAVYQFTRYLRDLPLQHDVTFDPGTSSYITRDE